MDKLTTLKFGTLLMLPLAIVACATTPDSDESTPPASTESIPASSESNVAFSGDYLRQPLGIIVRDLAQRSNSGMVLMNGLEAVIVPEFSVDDENASQAFRRLSDQTNLAMQSTTHYDFAYDRTYEALTTLSLDDVIPAEYANVRVDLAIGSDTPVFSALALIGHSTGLTLVADNAIGAAACGEMRLTNIPLTQALEALLQSARIPRANVRVLASDDYIFLASPAHRMRRELLAGADDTRPILDESVSLSLLVYTGADGQVSSQLGASPLGTILPELSLQLGIPIEATDELRSLPVNPVVINNVPRSMALNLIVRQWMIPAFQYEVREGKVLLRRAD